MTRVRHETDLTGEAPTAQADDAVPLIPAAAAPGRRRRHAGDLAASTVAQVRLQADELALLREAMRELGLGTTSEALREGIRLLVREAREASAAAEIRDFYAGRRAPLPEGVTPATPDELAAADSERW